MRLLDGKSLLVTGGTGSFGQRLVETVLGLARPERLVIYSRDELKQFEMAKRFPPDRFPSLRFFIGDVRDLSRLSRAMEGIDYVVHAAALKQVPTAEYNPFEAIKTNIIGAQNVIEAALDNRVRRVMALSTDKACNPINLYGATKLCSDKLFVAANSYAGRRDTRFGVVRYGNVLGSRGSILPLFLELRPTGRLPVTHPEMTRFWITLDQGVRFVMEALGRLDGGEILVPKIPSMRILDLARAIAPDCEIDYVGIRPGEKLHEKLISPDDARLTIEMPDFYVIRPQFAFWSGSNWTEGRGVDPDFEYASNTNTRWLGTVELRRLVERVMGVQLDPQEEAELAASGR